MDNELLRSHDGHVTRLTLNRPTKANALSASLVEALINAVEYAGTDGTRLLILDGNGNHFCAGFDFTGYAEASEGDLVLRFVRIEHLLQRIYHAPYATLALAHGKIFGAGADIVCACSSRVAAPGTTFRMPGLRFGLVLGTRRLAHRIGADAARDVLATSRTFDAAAALKLGRSASLRLPSSRRRGAGSSWSPGTWLRMCRCSGTSMQRASRPTN
ncbi:MAG: enoyl-CoA hydratase/isomerase family protein [Proteobacteria bacterium]|nr:enoyl-CoA hydratase/isomerase family protein [Pseudomonadota bacterium]